MNELPIEIKPHLNTQALASIKEANELAETYNSYFVIQNDRDYELSGVNLKLVSNTIRSLNDMRMEIARPINQSLKMLKAFFDGPVNNLTKTKAIINRGRLVYEEKLEEERKAEEERIRKIQEEERKRLEEEAKAKRQEEERLAAEAAAVAEAGKAEEAERLLQEAIIAEEEAAATEQQAEVMPTAIVPPVPLTKTGGVSTRTVWKAEVTDKMQLIKAVANGEVADIALDVNMKFLRQQAISLKTAFNIPGVRAYEQKSVAS